jgi:Ca2+-binding RTX toxin-like protein
MRDRSRPDLPRLLVPALVVTLLLVLVPLAAAAAPTPAADAESVAEDSGVTLVDVLLNDDNGDGGGMAGLEIVSVGTPLHGTATIDTGPPQKVAYSPALDYNGPDSFTYTVEDDEMPPLQGTATVDVTVTEVNDAPVAVADSYTMTSAGATIDVRTNDSVGPANEAAQTLTPSLVTTPSSGTAVVNPDGTISYTPTTTTAGNVSFTYSACDNGTTNGALDSKCANAAVSIEVIPTLAASDATVIEGDSGATAVTLQVSLNAVFGKTVTVDFATVNGTGMSGADYQSTSGTLTFAPGELVKGVSVNVVGDRSIEPDETFFVDLSNPTNATLADARGAATIRNDDSEGCDITGTAGADVLTGTAASETICGLGGNDRITGGGGDDIIIGGPGNDTIDGGNGGDTITGGAGNDRVAGGAGGDAIDGDAGNDTLSGDGGGDAIEGGGGSDVIRGGADSDTIDGGPGNDVAHGDAGNDVVDGHGGNDRLFGNAGDDRVDGGAGSDRVDGGAGNDWVNGGAGNERSGRGGAPGAGIFGGPGSDIVRGESGDNVFVPGAGNDTVQGGGARDTVLYSGARSGVVVDLTRRRATGEGRDNLTAVENVTGSRFADLLIGNSVANVLVGGAGNDRLFGRNGNDTLLGGPGNDVLHGEGGRDRCSVGPGGGSTSSC